MMLCRDGCKWAAFRTGSLWIAFQTDSLWTWIVLGLTKMNYHCHHHQSLAPTMLGSPTWILFLQFNLLWAKSLDRSLLQSMLTISIHVLFGLPLCLEGPSTCIEKLFLLSALAALHWTCPTISNASLLTFKYSYWCYTTTPKCFRMRSFLILSLLDYQNPSQYSHHCGTHFLHVFYLDWQIFCSISHSWSNGCLLKFFLQSCCYVPIISHSRSESSLQLSILFPMFDNLLNLSIYTKY